MSHSLKHVYVIDDDSEFVKKLVIDISKILTDNKINYEINLNLDNKIKSDNNNYSWYFLDVEMPNKSGFDLANEIYKFDKKAKIVFVSNFESYIFDSYDYHAVKFLLKTSYTVYLEKVIRRFLYEESSNYLCIYHDTPVLISAHNILYIEKMVNTIEIYINKKTKLTKNITLKKAIKELDEILYGRFVYINKSQIVNLEKIVQFSNDDLKLENDVNLHISRKFIKDFKKCYYQYIADLF